MTARNLSKTYAVTVGAMTLPIKADLNTHSGGATATGTLRFTNLGANIISVTPIHVAGQVASLNGDDCYHVMPHPAPPLELSYADNYSAIAATATTNLEVRSV